MKRIPKPQYLDYMTHPMKRWKAKRCVLCQLSGGLDSTAAAIQHCKNGDKTWGLFIDYGQPYLSMERDAVDRVDQKLSDTFPHQWKGCMYIKISLALHAPGCPVDYIPLRNLALTAHSINLAIAKGMDTVSVGSKAIRFRNIFTHPWTLFKRLRYLSFLEVVKHGIAYLFADPHAFGDCTIEFYKGIEQVARRGCAPANPVRVAMPLMGVTKREVVHLCRQYFELRELWWCYRPGGSPCGECGSCREVAEALDDSDIELHTQHRWS